MQTGPLEIQLPKPGWKRKLSLMWYVLILGYGTIVFVVALMQRRMLFVPTRFDPASGEKIAAGNGFEPWRNASGSIIGWKMSANGATTASVMIVHGNAGSAAGRDYIAQPILSSSAVDVFVLEYPGYGSREGSPSKASLIAAAEEAFALLPADRPRYVVCESLGSGVGGHLARVRSNDIRGMVFFVPYHSLPWVAQRRLPFLPAGLLLRDRFEPAQDLQGFRGPVKVVVAAEDEVIPPEAGRKLYESYSGPKELQVVTGAQHNEVAEQSPDWWRETFNFFEKQNNGSK